MPDTSRSERSAPASPMPSAADQRRSDAPLWQVSLGYLIWKGGDMWSIAGLAELLSGEDEGRQSIDDVKALLDLVRGGLVVDEVRAERDRLREALESIADGWPAYSTLPRHLQEIARVALNPEGDR